jgi:hypothetical protein
MKRVALFAAITVALVAALGWLFTLGFHAPGDGTAIRLSGLVAVIVQVSSFGVRRLLGPGKVLVGWGASALLRMATLVVYALVVTKALAVAVVPALISMAAFFFVTTLVEPVMLKP